MRRVHGGWEVRNVCKIEINIEKKIFKKRRDTISLMTTTVRDSFAVQMGRRTFLPPSPPTLPGQVTVPRGKWLWHLMIYLSLESEGGIISSEVRQATKKGRVWGHCMQKPSLDGLGF